MPLSRISNLKRVLVYAGHHKHPHFGPYRDGIEKRISMFFKINAFRKNPWDVSTFTGEELVHTLSQADPQKTLVAIPAGPTKRLEKVFSHEDKRALHDFIHRGGRGYFTCGSAYLLCDRHYLFPGKTQAVFKRSSLPLFQGEAKGPLCPFPNMKYKVGFYSDALTVTDGKLKCCVFLDGGGSFIPLENGDQKVTILARYLPEELSRVGKPLLEHAKWQNAAIMVSHGKGAALLSMFHPYYGSQDINVEAYEKAFPGCGTNWKQVHARLSSLDERMKFVNGMLNKLEKMDFSA